MSRRFVPATLLGVACFLPLLLPLPAAAQSMADIESKDFAGVQGLVVPPIARTDASKLIDAGTLDVTNFAHVTLNLAGEVKGTAEGTGEIGAILIPDVPPFDAAFDQLGLVPASIEIAAQIPARGGAYFMAKQRKYELGFPRYRVLLYNTSGSTVTVALFAKKTLN